MKHFEVTIGARSHDFACRCSTISEAFEAICDASKEFGIETDLDAAMEGLVNLKRGICQYVGMYRLAITVEDDEV